MAGPIPALLLSHLALTLLVAGLRFPTARDLIAPFPLGSRSWVMLTALLLLLAGTALRREFRAGRNPWGEPLRGAAWSLFVLVPALVWAVGDLWIDRGVDSAIVATGVGFALAAWWRTRASIGADQRPRVSWRAALIGAGRQNLRCVLPPTVLGAVLLLALREHSAVSAPQGVAAQWAVAAATYPIYAIAQLFLLLLLPWSLWAREGVGAGHRIPGVALLFAAVHWPNPLLVLATLFGMVAWAWAWARGAGLVPIAISMGILASLVAQTLPAELSGRMRTGPGYVLRQDHSRRLSAFDARVTALASDTAWRQGGSTLTGWLEHLHRETTGEPAPAEVVRAWTEHVGRAWRARVILVFMESVEFRRDHGIDRNFRESDRLLLHSTFRPWHPAHARFDSLRSDEAFRRAGESFPRFVRGLYRELLGRSPSEEELSSWPGHPSAPHREEIVRSFLTRAGVEDPLISRRRERPAIWPPVSDPGR